MRKRRSNERLYSIYLDTDLEFNDGALVLNDHSDFEPSEYFPQLFEVLGEPDYVIMTQDKFDKYTEDGLDPLDFADGG